MLFRIEDGFDISKNCRVYDNVTNIVYDTSQIDILIANEIRSQVNNSNNRSVFSYTKSLGTALFKYNYYVDNPIYLNPIPIYSVNCIQFDIIMDNKKIVNQLMPYSIYDLNYPIKQKLGLNNIILKNYIIDVSDNIQLDKYLRNYTTVGKKKVASCEKDHEVIIQHIFDEYIIEEYICVVYLIYALQYKTNFLNYFGVVEMLIQMFDEEIENKNEYESFIQLLLYLKNNWYYEYQISTQILIEKQQQGRIMPYDAYFVALDIMNGDIEEAERNCFYYLPYRIISKVWDIFKNRYKYSYLLINQS